MIRLQKRKLRSSHMVKVYNYTIPGDPTPENKVLNTDSPRIWDDYKQKRFNAKQNIRNQHKEKPPLDGSLKLSATFYMPIYPMKKHQELLAKHHDDIPSLIALFNFLDYVLKGIIYKEKSQIYEILVKKIYSEETRTEITIKRIE